MECLPAAVLDSEVEERIGCGETSFWEKRVVEHGLVIDLLGLLGNELVWIFRRGWCRPRGGAGSLSFGLGRLPWGHVGRFGVRDLQTQKKKKIREGEERAAKFVCVCGGGGGGGEMNRRSDI